VEVRVVLFVVYGFAIVGLIAGTVRYLLPPSHVEFFGFCLNIILYGVLSLLSFMTYRQETHFRGIFFQFWILFACFALIGPAVLFASKVGGPVAAVGAYVTTTLLIHVLFAWVIAKVLFHYVFRDEKRWAVNLLSALVVLPLCLWLFWPYWWSPVSILQLPSAASAATIYTPVLKPAIVVNILCLLMLLAFFLHKLRTDTPIGAFADTLLFLFGLFILFDAVELTAQVNSVELLNITQWAFAAADVAMVVTLLMRLHYKAQTIADYYESQCVSHDPRVGRRIGLFDRLVLWGFFDPEKVGQRVFLGAGHKKVMVKRGSPRVTRPSQRE
jgi:hypothetical protein